MLRQRGVATPQAQAPFTIEAVAGDKTLSEIRREQLANVLQRRHFFVRDMVESFELKVPFVRTADNLADFFTKPMKSASQFHALRKRIMNDD